eukprot:5114910-Amphidinium_carterae.2
MADVQSVPTMLGHSASDGLVVSCVKERMSQSALCLKKPRNRAHNLPKPYTTARRVFRCSRLFNQLQ